MGLLSHSESDGEVLGERPALVTVGRRDRSLHPPVVAAPAPAGTSGPLPRLRLRPARATRRGDVPRMRLGSRTDAAGEQSGWLGPALGPAPDLAGRPVDGVREG